VSYKLSHDVQAHLLMAGSPSAPIRQRVLSLVGAGLATEAEAARLAGVSRMTVRRWCSAAGIVWPERRGAALIRAWNRTGRRRKSR